jgi:hypothetical protein
MEQVCQIVTIIAPNTTQEVDCLFQLGQLYSQAIVSDPHSHLVASWGESRKKYFGNSLRVAHVCLGPYHPHTVYLNKQYES